MESKRPVYAGYVRVSKVGLRDADDLRSPDIQRKAIGSLAEREGFDVEWLNPQLNVSGAKADREAIMRAVERVETGELAGIAVYKLDRLSRLAPRQRIELFERIEGERGEKPGRVKSAAEAHDPTTPRGRFARDMFLSLARLQWEEAQEGFAQAVETAIGNGCHAHAGFGYCKPRREDGKVAKGQPLELVDEEAKIVRELFHRRAAGASWSDLARWADSTGVPPRRAAHWSRRGIENIVRNRAYLGEARYGDHVKLDAHPAIVTPDDFEAANVARGVRPARGEPALLSGLVRCAGCRHKMRAAVVGDRKQRVYRCDRRHGSGICPAPASVSRELLDALVWDEFVDHYQALALEPHAKDQSLADARSDLVQEERGLVLYLEVTDINAVGVDAYRSGQEARLQRIAEKKLHVARLRANASGLNIGHRELQELTDAPTEERRLVLTAGMDTAFVRRALLNGRNRGLDPERVHIVWRDEAPSDLPGPGVRTDLRSFDW